MQERLVMRGKGRRDDGIDYNRPYIIQDNLFQNVHNPTIFNTHPCHLCDLETLLQISTPLQRLGPLNSTNGLVTLGYVQCRISPVL